MLVTRMLVPLLIASALAACDAASPPPPKQYTWTEDVTFDARSVRVRRVVTVKESNSWSGDAYNAVETLSRIEFMDELASLPQWNVPLRPVAMYQDATTDEWVVVASTTSCQVWHAAGKPKPPYWEYRLRERGWQQVPLSQASLGRAANLAQDYAGVAAVGHLTPELRPQIDYDANRHRTFREVHAEPNQAFCGEGHSSKP
jgi:hypothetical protein